MTIEKSKGCTDSERYLAGLCERSFLGLWSYPNVFYAPGKELCDLLVVCGEDVIVFSDKSCAFPDTGDARVDWGRWYRKSVARSVAQSLGAERRVRMQPARLYLDARCTRPFPLRLPPVDRLRFHRVVIALGAKDRCAAHTGGTGSLLLCPDISAAEDEDVTPPPPPPFTLLGPLASDAGKGVAHVFDDVTLDIVMGELDTITDFVRYLRKKEALLASRRMVFAAGEQDLLAMYASEMNGHGEHDFVIWDGDAGVNHLDNPDVRFFVVPGRWEKFRRNPRVVAKGEANGISYLWDRIISEFTKHTIRGTLGPCSPDINDTEASLRLMALENRTNRRMLGQAFFSFIKGVPPGYGASRHVIETGESEVAYVFMVVPPETYPSRDVYLTHRRLRLANYCRVVAWKYPNRRFVVGIATDPDNAREHSFDLVRLDRDHWSAEDDELAEEIQRRCGFLTRVAKQEFSSSEYPMVAED